MSADPHTPHFPVYYASAGSGKTFNLVREYLERCLMNPEPDKMFAHILAITFTNKAAGEMKERVVRALRQYAQDKPEMDDMGRMIMENTGLSEDRFFQRSRQLLTGILHEYDRFSVGTIDKFNSKILRTFALDLDLPLSYEVEMEVDRLIEEASDRLLDRLGDDDDVTELVSKFSAQQMGDDKDWRIQRDLHAKGKLLFQEQHRVHLQRLAEIAPTDFLSSIQRVQSRREALAKITKTGVQNLYDMVQRHGEGPADFPRSSFPNWLEKHRTLRYAADLDMLTEDKGEVTYRVQWLQKGIENGDWLNKKAPESDRVWIEEHGAELSQRLLKLLEHYREDVRLSLYARNLYGVAVLSLLDQALEEVKRERNVVHISEFNRTIADQVRQQPVLYIYERLGERYVHYFIDEFQDTSVMQWQNLLPLAHEALSKKGSVMVVGDGKQAIYRWRGGEVESFLGLTAGIRPQYPSGAGVVEVPFAPKPIRLKDNFRSRAKIVKFNNELYTQASSQLNDPEFVKLYAAAHQNPRGASGGYITMHCYAEEENTEAYDAAMCAWTLDRIHEVLSRGARHSDICVLVRNGKEGRAVAEFLQGEGMPVISNESLLLSASPEVNVLLQFLRWKSQGNDKDALSRIFLYLFDKLKLNASDRHQLVHQALKEGEYERILKQLMPLWDAAAWEQRTLYEKMNTLSGWIPGFAAESAYVEFFLDLCHQFSVRAQGTETEFLEWWSDTYEKHSIVVPKGLDAVQVMTIHKSKGLEFPVVVLPRADWAPKTNLANDWYILPEKEAESIGLPEVLLNINKDMKVASADLAELYDRNVEAMTLDDLNLLYVATTRAVDELHIAFRSKVKGPGVQEYLKEYAQTTRMVMDPGASTNWGEPVTDWPKPKEQGEQVEQQRGAPEEWRSKLRLSFEANRYWGAAGDARPYGIEVHRLLQEIGSLDDVERVLHDWETDGLLDPSAREGLIREVREMLQRPEVAKYFDANHQARNEASILVPGDATQRPDRLVFHSDGGVSVVDFKTGAPSADHRAQVDDYANLLNLAGVSVVNRALIYVSPYRLDENW